MNLSPFLSYVVDDPYFWPSMGLTTATAMFVGVLLHDGNMKQAYKAEVTILSYAAYLFMTTVPRVISHIDLTKPEHLPAAFAGTTTIFFVTIFYTLGLLLGVLISYNRHKRHGSL